MEFAILPRIKLLTRALDFELTASLTQFPLQKMETFSRLAFAPSPSFLRFAVSPRPLTPSRVSIGRLRSHDYNMIKPKKREHRSKQRWRWEDLSALDPEEEDRDPTREEDAMSDEEMAEELEVLEKEVMEGLDKGREPSDYDRRAHIFDESSRVFKVMKEKGENGGTDVNGDSS